MSVAQHRDLWSGHSVWERDFSNQSEASLAQDTRCDVLIVGAGISGALMAEAVSKRGMSAMVLERRRLGRGSTAASTALVEWQTDTPLIHLRQQIVIKQADRVWLRSFESVDRLKKKIESLSLASDYAERQSIELNGNVLDPDELAIEAKARREIGLPTEFLAKRKLEEKFGITNHSALLSDFSAEINPVKLTTTLFDCARHRGVQVLENEEPVTIEPGLKEVSIETSNGRAIYAQYLVFATGYEVPDLIPADGYSVISTWAIATKVQPDKLWPGGALISEASKPYLYIRTTNDGRIIAGGEDEPYSPSTVRKELLAEKTLKIEQKLKTIFPNADCQAEFNWSGAFGESRNGIPLIGKIPGSPRCYGVLGYGGNGTTYSMIAAELIVSDICGESDPDAYVFRFSDIPTLPP